MAKNVIGKLGKWIFLVMGFFLLLIIIGGVILMMVVDREWIEGKMSAALHRQVTVEKIKAGIFSAVSGIEIRQLRISNLKSEKELKPLKGIPVAREDLFLEIKSLTLKARLLALLKKRVELKELTLQEPYVRIISMPDGSYNFSDLMGEETTEETRPISADDLGGALSLNKINVHHCTIDLEDGKTKQINQVYDFSLQIPSVEIDPVDLQNKNSAELQMRAGVKSLTPCSDCGYRSFDLKLESQIHLGIFSPQTRRLDPRIHAAFQSPQGIIKGIKMLAKLRENAEIVRFCGKLDFLKEDLAWNNGRAEIKVEENRVTLTGGNIDTSDMRLTFSGTYQMASGIIDFDLGILLDTKYTPMMRNAVRKKANALIPGNAKKYVSPETIADIAMKQAVNQEGRIFLECKATGKADDPKITLIRPVLPSLQELVKEAMKGYLKNNRGELENQGKKLLKKIF